MSYVRWQVLKTTCSLFFERIKMLLSVLSLLPLLAASVFSASEPPSDESSSSPYVCERTIHIYERLNFKTRVPIDGKWGFLALGPHMANDAAISYSPKGGIMSSKTYRRSGGQLGKAILDDVKAFYHVLDPAGLPSEGFLNMKMVMGSKSFRTESASSPFTTEAVFDNDIRFASSGFMAIDHANNLLFGFQLTNDRVYVVYQKFNLDDKEDKVFRYSKAVAERKVSDLHELEIVMDCNVGRVLWKLAGEEVFVIDKYGLSYEEQADGVAKAYVWPTAVDYGFGSFSGLSYPPTSKLVNASPTDEAADLPPQRSLLVKAGDGMLWGQGTMLNLQSLLVYTETNSCGY